MKSNWSIPKIEFHCQQSCKQAAAAIIIYLQFKKLPQAQCTRFEGTDNYLYLCVYLRVTLIFYFEKLTTLNYRTRELESETRIHTQHIIGIYVY
jgi:hypothetical protein